MSIMKNNKKDDKNPLVSLEALGPSVDSTQENNRIVPIDTNDKDKFETESSSSEIDDEDEEKPNIPDGGYGWVVVFASFMITVIINGVRSAIGLLYIEFLNEFKASSSATSWIGSLFMALPLITGPIMSALVDKYGCRSTSIASGIISTVGFVISSRCYSITLMYLSFGILTGLAQGVNFITTVVSIAFWFDKKRALAVGIGTSGAGVGAFVFSPVTSYLIKEYGWRGATLLLAGCFLNICVFGVLLREPGWTTEQKRKKDNLKLTKSEKSSKTSILSESSTNISKQNDILFTRGNDLQKETSLKSNADTNKLKRNCHSALNLPTYVKQNEKVPTDVSQLHKSNKKAYNVISPNNYPGRLMRKNSSVDNFINAYAKSRQINEVSIGFNMEVNKEQNESKFMENQKEPKINSATLRQSYFPKAEDQEPPLSPLDTEKPEIRIRSSFRNSKKRYSSALRHGSYIRRLKSNRHSLIHHSGFTMNKKMFKASSCPNIFKEPMMSLPKPEDEKPLYSEIVDLLKDMCDYSLFLELHFFLFSLSTLILCIWMIVPYFYVAELMLRYGYSAEQASLTLSNIGISNTIGVLFFGWAGGWMSITKMYAICLVLSGLSIGAMMFFVQNFIALEIFTALFGIFVSSTFTLTPAILMEIVPLDRFALSYGLQLLCMGIGVLVGPPFSGLLYDVTGSWHQPFYQTAIWIVIAGVLVGIIPFTKNRKIIGKGPVEKEIEESENRMTPLIFLLISLVLLVVLLLYLFITSLMQNQQAI